MNVNKGALISLSEVTTDRLLRCNFHGKPFLIHKDVSVRQVINAKKDELSAGEWTYYEKAAFDFVICKDDSTQSYELIIEYDGFHHEKPDQAFKDRLKDRICQNAGLPILRIGTDDIKLREDTQILDFILDQYFGEKYVSSLREEGKLSHEEEYFVGFPAVTTIQKRLIKRHLYPPLDFISALNSDRRREAERIYWYQIQDKKIDCGLNPAATHRFWTAMVDVNVIKGSNSSNPIIQMSRTASIRDCNPNSNVSGVHGWHIALELAKYYCFSALEIKWREYKIV